MRFTKVRVLWLLAIVVLSKADSGESEDGDEINCNSVQSVQVSFYDCFYTGYGPGTFINFTRLTSSEVPIKGPYFLSEVASACRGGQTGARYTKCIRNIKRACPNLANILQDSAEEKMSLLCTNNEPSQFIKEVLNEDFVLNPTCFQMNDNDVLHDVMQCVNQTQVIMSPIIGGLETATVPDAISIYKRMISFMLQCTTATYYDNETLQCGSKKKDMLLTFWILVSSIADPIKPTIGPEATNTLRLMMSSSYR